MGLNRNHQSAKDLVIVCGTPGNDPTRNCKVLLEVSKRVRKWVPTATVLKTDETAVAARELTSHYERVNYFITNDPVLYRRMLNEFPDREFTLIKSEIDPSLVKHWFN